MSPFKNSNYLENKQLVVFDIFLYQLLYDNAFQFNLSLFIEKLLVSILKLKCVVFLQVLGSVQRRFEMAVSRPDLKQVMASENVKRDILLVLECLCGVAEATRANSAAVAFEFIHILLSKCAPLIGKCLCCLPSFGITVQLLD